MTASVLVHIAPTLTTLSPGVFPSAIVEGALSGAVSGAALLADAHAGTTAKGVAIVGALGTGGAGTGTWLYQLAGTTTWTPLLTVSPSSAFLLPGTASIRFQSVSNQYGTATLAYLAWDASAGTAGKLFGITSTGGATAFSSAEASATLAVQPINHAPTWTATSFALPAIPSSAANPAGESISQLVGSSFADIDAVSHVGVAIIGATGGTTGAWQYYNGTSWLPLGAPTAATARLLSGADLVRYVPNAGFNGTVTLTVRPWDGSTGSDYAIVKLSTTAFVGGNTAFGLALATITQVIHDAPTLGNTTPVVSPWTTALTEGSASTAVTVTALMHDAAVSTGTIGIAIVGAVGGTWQYQNAGSTLWNAVPSVSESSAFLVPSSASIRFLSTANGHGTETLTFRAWDGSAGAADKPFTVPAIGGATSISSAQASASVTVNAINHAPTWTVAGLNLKPVLPGATPPGNTVASAFSNYFTDLDGNPPGIAVTALSGTTNGTWQYSLDGVNWINMPTTGANAVSLRSALLLSANDYLRFVPKSGFLGTATFTAFAWDGTTGSAGQSANLATAGQTAFSSTSLIATVLVNTAPTL